jgi:hypothetical protein
MLYAGQKIIKVGLRELQRNASKYLRKTEEPFCVTKDHKPYLMVIPYHQAMQLLVRADDKPVLGPAHSTYSSEVGDNPTRTTYPPLKQPWWARFLNNFK